MLVKLYGGPTGNLNERRYSAGECCGTIKGAVCGQPDEFLVSTSYVGRQNLTMRMGMRRFTRRTNGFSKKVENLEHAVALHFMNYNFARIHKTLWVTPAMETGVSDHVWTPGDQDNWRCVPLRGLTNVSAKEGPWHSAPNHTRPQTCVSQIDVEATY
jgi:hypothetical protein